MSRPRGPGFLNPSMSIVKYGIIVVSITNQ